MSDDGPAGLHRTTTQSTTPAPDDLARRMRALGGDLARVLRSSRRSGRPHGSALRSVASDAATTSGNDLEVHRILIDVGVAAQHLQASGTLRTYARAKQRVVEGPAATAFLAGVLHRIEHYPDD